MPAKTTTRKPRKQAFRVPKSVAVCADKLYELRRQRQDLQKEVDAMIENEKLLKDYIIRTLPKSQASGAAGKVARVTVEQKETPRCDDWDAFYKHVKRTGDFDLMQRRLSNSAVEERWDNGKKIPGLSKFKYKSVSLNKI